MNSTAALLDRVVTDLGELLQSNVIAALSETDRLALLRAAGDVARMTEAVVVEAVASADPELPAHTGCRSVNELLQRALRTDSQGAARLTRASRLVAREQSMTSGEFLPARWPQLRDALLDGTIGVAGLLAATTPVEQAAHRVGRTGILQADAELAEYARGCRTAEADAEDPPTANDTAPPATPDDLRQLALVIAMTLDPDGAEPADMLAQRQRSLTIGRERDGVFPIHGHLLPEVRAQLQLIIDAQLNPKVDGPPVPGVAFRPDDESADGAPESDPFNSDPRNVIDSRTRAQKQHDALAAALSIAARHEEMPSLAGAAPTLVVHVDAEDFTHGTGWATLPGTDAPVPLAVAAQTACAGSVQRVLFDEGRIVGISVTDRVFTAHQRRAITLRDEECLIPGCHVPSTWCEIHHVTEHAAGGPTHTDNGVPLCFWHHRSLGRSGWEIRMDGGQPQIRGPAWWDPLQQWRTPRPRTMLPRAVPAGAG